MRTVYVAIGVGLLGVAAILLASLDRRSGERASLVITGGTVVTMDAAGRIIPNGAVVIEGSKIVAVGTASEIGQRAVTRRVAMQHAADGRGPPRRHARV